MADQRPRPALARGREHQRRYVVALLEQLGHRFDGVALAHDDRRRDPGFLADRARGLEQHRFGAQPRFLSIAAWTPPHSTNSWGGMTARISSPPPLRAARRAAKRRAVSASSVSSITTR